MRGDDNASSQIGFVEDGGIEADKSLKLPYHKLKNLSRPKTLKIRPGKFKNRIQLHLNFRACFFFNDTATTEIYTLSLHDALPISSCDGGGRRTSFDRLGHGRSDVPKMRSEEHTSELQSQSNLVCRLLLEKKKAPFERQRSPGGGILRL